MCDDDHDKNNGNTDNDDDYEYDDDDCLSLRTRALMYRVCAQLFQLNTFVLVPFLHIIPKPITISIDIQKKTHTQRSARVQFSYFYFTFRFSSIVWMIREGEKSIFIDRIFSYNRRYLHIAYNKYL